MEALAITNKGIEDITQLEIKELLNETSKIELESCVVFKIKNYLDLCRFCYKTQSAIKAIFLLGRCKADKNSEETFKNIEKLVRTLNFKEWIDKKTGFLVRCKRFGSHDYQSLDIEQKTGEFILKNIKQKQKFDAKVDVSNPDTVFYIYIYNNHLYFGIDFSARDLSKRHYKIFASNNSLKGNIAYAIARIGGTEGKEKILDPNCNDGTLAIETALHKMNFPVNYYNKDFAFKKLKPLKKENFDKFFDKIDKSMIKKKTLVYGSCSEMRNLTACKKNAKIAGIDKYVDFSRIDIEWLDTKFDKNSIDKIITVLPCESKHNNKKDISKLYDEFFFQVEFILKKKCTLTLACLAKDLLIEKAGKYFKLEKEREVYNGEQRIFVLNFRRK